MSDGRKDGNVTRAELLEIGRAARRAIAERFGDATPTFTDQG